jgi:glutamyl-Q tRNA(Asp) synthetase
VNAAGEKLSKSAGATAVDPTDPGKSASTALGLLGLELPANLAGAPPRELWTWAAEHWRIGLLAERPAITAEV